MNKKRLSVVMAGAMLASSVAPVLAAEEVTIPEAQKGNLINEITDLLWEAPRFSNDARNDASILNAKHDRKGGSVYTVKIKGEENTTIYDETKKDILKSDFQKKVQEEINKLSVGDKIEIVALGYEKVTEKNKEIILASEKTTTYTAPEIENTNGVVYEELKKLHEGTGTTKTGFDSIVDYDNSGYKSGTGYVIKLTKKAAETADMEEIVLKAGETRLDFTHYISSINGKVAVGNSAITDFVEFAEADAKYVDIADKVEKTYKIATDGTTLALSDIFDGVMLTEKGYALLNAAKEVEYVLNAKGEKTKYDNIVKSGTNVTNANLNTVIDNLDADKNGVYKLTLEIADANRVAVSMGKGKTWKAEAPDFNTYYITSKSKAELKKVLAWIDNRSADVEEIAGSDRYATAVKVAKELAGLEKVAKAGNIVLVNGNSLVDGLAAAPLAEHLGTGVTPILLTENDKLPTATKKYLAELLDTEPNNDVTVSIVGGNGVVSRSVEKELKDMNLKVKRYAGEDREGTSMAVAEKIGTDNGAFVVGATGEADAMSIAGKAAEMKAPIIVSGFNGLSDDTLYELEGARVTVIGGDSAVSEADYAAIKDVALTLGRVSGSDRKETNAEVIRKFYNGTFAGTKTVVVAKDDVLIDALTSANLAAKKKAPIVLGTKELSANQIEAIAKNADASTATGKVYQIGYGVERSVVKLVAQSLGLI